MAVVSGKCSPSLRYALRIILKKNPQARKSFTMIRFIEPRQWCLGKVAGKLANYQIGELANYLNQPFRQK